MTLLGQQELVEPEPTRRVIVGPGRAAFWAVDPSTLRCAVASIAADGLRGVELVSFPKVDGPARLSCIYADVRALAVDLAGLVAPGLVVVEQPSGTYQSLELDFAVGVTMAGLYDGILAVCGSPARFEMVTSSWWKKRALGYGRMSKPSRKSLGRAPTPGDYPVMVWAWENGMPRSVTSWDCGDAWAIAEAARRDVVLESR